MGRADGSAKVRTIAETEHRISVIRKAVLPLFLVSGAAGFVMVPLLGLQDSFLIVVMIQFSAAVLVVFFSEESCFALGVCATVVSPAVLALSVLKIPRDVFLRTIITYHYPSEIIYIKDSATGTVTVHDLPLWKRSADSSVWLNAKNSKEVIGK